MLRIASRRVIAPSFGRRLLSVHRARPTVSSSAEIAVGSFQVTSPHARLTTQSADDYMLMHSVYTPEEVTSLKTDVHFTPGGIRDKIALAAITAVRRAFDFVSGYDVRPGKMTADKYLIRAIFLETVAGVPGALLTPRANPNKSKSRSHSLRSHPFRRHGCLDGSPHGVPPPHAPRRRMDPLPAG